MPSLKSELNYQIIVYRKIVNKIQYIFFRIFKKIINLWWNLYETNHGTNNETLINKKHNNKKLNATNKINYIIRKGINAKWFLYIK